MAYQQEEATTPAPKSCLIPMDDIELGKDFISNLECHKGAWSKIAERIILNILSIPIP